MTDYKAIQSDLRAIFSGERDLIANLSNASAIIWSSLKDINWAGFYRMTPKDLILGPFQGKVACIHIPIGKGVCGTCVQENKTQLVKDVHQFKGHIACDSASNSEIVIPLHSQGKIVGVLDIDSPLIGRFNEDDKIGLEECAKIIEEACDWNI